MINNMVNSIKRLIKRIIGRDGYAVLLNTKLGSKLHDCAHSNSSTSRDFLLQMLPKSSIGLEIGVNDGDFSERILEIVRPKKLYLIDPWKFFDDDKYSTSPYGRKNIDNQNMMDIKYENVKKRFSTLINKNHIVICRGLSEDLSKTFGDNYFDWIYVDGNHFYEFVKKDLDLYSSKVKIGGFITGDDYYPGDLSGNGVKRAVDEFVSSGLAKLIQLKNNQFILQKTA